MSATSPADGIYDRLWAEAESAFQSGRVEVDPYLDNRANDRRLGLTVIGRPKPAVSERFISFLNQVKRIAPEQHFYRGDEFHLTILSLFTATEAFEPHWENRAAYRAAVDQALQAGQAFAVRYQGITASKSAVMIQGFSTGPQLNQLRNKLRQALRDASLGGGLDERYAIDTAHTTALRFKSRPVNPAGLLALLRQYRTTDFGTSSFSELQLVKNNWYMSHDRVAVLARYSLVAGP
jgi:2'-5' RNA ligase